MNDILFGKKGISRIVSIEPQDDIVEIFFEDYQGNISSKFEPHKYWLLSNKLLDNDFKRLKGDLFYKYGKLYTERSAFLRDRGIYKREEIFSVFNPKEACAIKDGYSCFLDMEINEVSLLSFDLETTTLNPEDPNAKILLISAYYRGLKGTEKKLFCYDEYLDQADLIEAFCAFVRRTDPTILLGHNIFGFDLNYLRVMAEKSNASLWLGRNEFAAQFDDYERKFRVDGNRDLHYHDCRVYGREIIDTMFLALKADIGRKYNSYGLKPIIEQEGWTLPNRTFYDSSKIRENYTNKEEWSKIKRYCEDDAQDAITLFDKFIPPFFYMCRSVAKGSLQTLNNSATGSQLNSIMCRAYLQQAHSLPKADDITGFQGAYSLGVPGVYKNCLRWDVQSLYPSLMLQYRISNQEKDPNDYMLSMLDYFLKDRLKNKKLAKETGKDSYKHLEQSAKIFLNSTYGFLSAPGLLFNSPNEAAEVTKKGRETLNMAIEWATGKNYETWQKNSNL